MYCVYSDREVPSEQGNFDHIVPLALGGHDAFTIWCDRKFNSFLGHSIDGAIANDPLVNMALMRKGIKGHSKKVAATRWKKSSFEGRPAQVTITPSEIFVWDAQDRRILSHSETANKPINSELIINRNIGFKFLARVALGSGYFLYEDRFLSKANCESLRTLISIDLYDPANEARIKDSPLIICDRFHEDAAKGGSAYRYRAICETSAFSILIAELFSEGIAFHVGIASTYFGSIFVPTEQAIASPEEIENLGDTIILAHPKPIRMPLKTYLKYLNAHWDSQRTTK